MKYLFDLNTFHQVEGLVNNESEIYRLLERLDYSDVIISTSPGSALETVRDRLSKFGHLQIGQLARDGIIKLSLDFQGMPIAIRAH